MLNSHRSLPSYWHLYPAPVTHPHPFPRIPSPRVSLLHHLLVAPGLLCPRSFRSLGTSWGTATAGVISPPIRSPNVISPECRRSIVLIQQKVLKLGRKPPKVQERMLPTMAYPYLAPSDANGRIASTLSRTRLIRSDGTSISRATLSVSPPRKTRLKFRSACGMGAIICSTAGVGPVTSGPITTSFGSIAPCAPSSTFRGALLQITLTSTIRSLRVAVGVGVGVRMSDR